MKINPTLRASYQQQLDHDNWRDYLSARMWAHLDAWENEGGR